MKVQIVNKSTNPLPQYQTSGSAGMDVQAFIDTPILIHPGQRYLVPTGIFMAIESGYECQVRSRSGLASKTGVIVLNSPGTIDSDYRGEVQILLYNTSGVSYTVEPGDRIAQLVFAKCEQPEIEQFLSLDSLDDTSRGSGGFGSTGK